jgi:hypothetical protein
MVGGYGPLGPLNVVEKYNVQTGNLAYLFLYSDAYAAA